MDYRTLGNSGCAVSNLCLGTMTFGSETDEQGSYAQLDLFLESGGTLVDTADVYSSGVSEEIIGRWYRDRPADVTERVVLATKGRFATGQDPNALGLSTRHLTRALDASLARLQLDRIDLYQVHAYDPWTPLEETLRTLAGFIAAGKISYYGLSNYTGWQLTKVVHLAKALNVPPPVTLQPQYSLIVREIEWEVVPAVLDAGMGMLPWSPLGGGWLSGKYSRDQRPTGESRLGEDPNRGMEAYDRRGTERTWAIIDAVQKVAEDRGVSMAEVALAWVTDRPGVTSTILGARTTEQLEANLKAADLHLDPEETAALNEASDPGAADYPYGEMGVEQRNRVLSGPSGTRMPWLVLGGGARWQVRSPPLGRSGPTVVLLHAGVADRRSWAGTAKRLAGSVDLVAYDRPRVRRQPTQCAALPPGRRSRGNARRGGIRAVLAGGQLPGWQDRSGLLAHLRRSSGRHGAASAGRQRRARGRGAGPGHFSAERSAGCRRRHR